MKKILRIFLVWRLILFIPLYFGSRLISYRSGYDYTNIWKFTHGYFPISSPLLFPWANFDGVHYLSIAANGYSNDLGFFPLFPIAIKFLAILFGGVKAFDLGYFLSGFLVSNICLGFSLWIFYKLISIDFPKKIALESIIFLLIFPTSFFFASIYSESLFLLLALLSFYFARNKNWFLSGLFAMLLSATRIVGIAIIPALIYEFFKEEKKLSAKFLPLILSPIGLLLYALYNKFQFGDTFLFIEAHAKINPTRTVSSVILIPQTIFRYIKILATTNGYFEWWIALLEISLFTFAVIMLYFAFKKKIRASYLIYSAFALLIPASSGTFSGLPRYIIVLFPMFMALALIKKRSIKIIYMVTSIVLLFILLALFSRGYFVA